MMIIKSILLGIALDYLTFDELNSYSYFATRHECVTLHVWGKLTPDLKHVQWDMKLPANQKAYQRAREKLGRSLVPNNVI